MAKNAMAKGKVYRIISDAMNGVYTSHLHPDSFQFKPKLRLVKERNSGSYTIINIKEGNVCEQVSADWVAQEILAALKGNTDMGESDFCLDFSDCKKVVENWVAYTSRTDGFVYPSHPQAIAFANETHRTCYHRLPFNKEKIVEPFFPKWEEILSRMTNRDAFCMFVWSLFEENADISQYLYIYGLGGCGKSAIGAWLQRLVGSAFTSAASDQMYDKHWSEAIVGKRLCYIKEANSGFPKSDKFKALTGDRQLRVNPKGLKGYDTVHQCKFAFVSNYKLEITSKSEDTRRAIYCELTPFEGKAMPDDVLSDILWSETAHFLSYCMTLYYKACGLSGEKIPVNINLYDDIIAETESDVRNILDQWFVKSADSKVTSADFQKFCTIVGLGKYKKKEILEHLDRNWGVRRTTVRVDGSAPINSFKGMKLTLFAEAQLKVDNVIRADFSGR